MFVIDLTSVSWRAAQKHFIFVSSYSDIVNYSRSTIEVFVEVSENDFVSDIPAVARPIAMLFFAKCVKRNLPLLGGDSCILSKQLGVRYKFGPDDSGHSIRASDVKVIHSFYDHARPLLNPRYLQLCSSLMRNGRMEKRMEKLTDHIYRQRASETANELQKYSRNIRRAHLSHRVSILLIHIGYILLHLPPAKWINLQNTRSK